LIDPYVKVVMLPWTIAVQTKQVNDYQPGSVATWNEKLILPVPNEQQLPKNFKLAVQVWDEDVGADDICGQGSITKDIVEQAISKPNEDVPVECELKDQGSDEGATVCLQLRYVPVENPEKSAPGKWKRGGSIKGNLEVDICTATDIKNPDKEVDVTKDFYLYTKGALLCALYFGLNALVFMLTSTTTNEEGEKEFWSFLDTVYFGVVTITTTGYGDLLPSNNAAKAYSMVNCYVGVGIISSVLGFIVAGLMERRATDLVDEMQGKFGEKGNQLSGGLVSKVCSFIPIPRHVCIAFLFMTIQKVLSILFFTHADRHMLQFCAGHDDGDCVPVACPVPALSTASSSLTGIETLCDDCVVYNSSMWDTNHMGEPFCHNGHMFYNLNLVTAAYMSSVTVTSVGYGDFSPQGEDARAFAIFWILIGTLLTGNAWGSLNQWLLKTYQLWLDKNQHKKEFDAKSIMQIDKDKGGEVDEFEFVTHMLLKSNKLDLVTLRDIREQFHKLDASGDGVITKEDLEKRDLVVPVAQTKTK